MKLVIKGGRVIDPATKTDHLADVVVADGLIATVNAPQASYADTEIIDATGLIVAPGFVDLHTHLREPGFTNKETVATGTKAAAKGGFTTICAMPNTNPVIDSFELTEYLKSVVVRDAQIRVELIGAITKGSAGAELTDMARLAEAGVVAFSDDGLPVASAAVMRRALELASDVDLPIINHAEDPELVGAGLMNEGAISLRLGLHGTPAAAEAVMVARDIEIAMLTGAKLHIPHISTAQALAHIARAKAAGYPVTAEATPHHLSLTDSWVMAKFGETGEAVGKDAYDTNTRVNPPLRTQVDVDALVAGLADGTIDAVATDHAPHGLLDKETTFDQAAPGISGLETAFGLLARLVHDGKLELSTLIERLTCAPANIIKREVGALKKGYSADIVLLDMNREWVVDVEKFVSLGKNTPLNGMRLKGTVCKTIFKGEVVYDADA